MDREIKLKAWVTEYADEGSKGYMIDLPQNKLSFEVTTYLFMERFNN